MAEIISLGAEDALAVSEIAAVSFPEKWSEGDFLYFLNHDHRLTLGCRSADGRLAAYFVGLLVQGDLDIVSLATRPDLRNGGLGKRLLAAVLSDPRVERAFLEVRVSNLLAQKLYERAGFKAMGTRKKYYGGTEDALQLRWTRS